MDEQSATTKEVAENIAETSQGMADVNRRLPDSSAAYQDLARDILRIREATGEVSGNSGDVTLSAEQLNQLAEELRDKVGIF